MMTRYQKLLAILLVSLLLSACGNSAPAEEAKQSETVQIQMAQQDEETAADITDLCAQMLLKLVPEPTYSSVGGEWSVIGLSRWEGKLPERWIECYWNNLCDYISGCGGVLSDRKYTEYSRVILAATAIGKNPADINGYNMLLPLADFEQTVFQGTNGPVYALLALDSGDYEIPVNTAGGLQATRELYVDYILNAESEGGGWSLAGGAADVDITAMTLQALAKYRDRIDVAEAVERALAFLSAQQNDQGSFTSFNAESSESISQTITALAELGVSLDDSRFVKNDNTLMDALLRYQNSDGGFSHLVGGETDLLATEQAFYALIAVSRMEQGKSSLYDMK